MHTFTKDERLSKKKIIQQLFAEGKSFVIRPFRIWWLFIPDEIETQYPVQVLISVPKRNIRKAVNRNLIKRRIKEAYRINKTWYYDGLQKSGYTVAFVYMENKPLLFEEIQEKIILILKRLQKENEKTIG